MWRDRAMICTTLSAIAICLSYLYCRISPSSDRRSLSIPSHPTLLAIDFMEAYCFCSRDAEQEARYNDPLAASSLSLIQWECFPNHWNTINV
ncbi:hypothetical protein BJ138DRAFT_1149135 [Hygrophoropsis aurantiaca]|uniref:Uncharacterized protein n=1 Tax=Hygrophoropsis aurantiaca TaxID=72124 RepID=A0ACB8AGJ8_9AGAM|nr:hypothetical protein BJ138DRAFT_1149135 [Hygrophoropsis aurantiaca]